MSNSATTADACTRLTVHTGADSPGYPFAVVLAEALPAPDAMRDAARQIGTETAFLAPKPQPDRSAPCFATRWFSPHGEIQLCGAGALGAASLLLQHRRADLGEVAFETSVGALVARRSEGGVGVRLPRRALSVSALPEPLLDALGRPAVVRSARADAAATVVLALATASDVAAVQPDFARLAQLDADRFGAVIVTAPGDACDYVFRYFTPWHGSDESAFAGSAHSVLGPFWARENGQRLRARQLAVPETPFSVRPTEEGVWIYGGARLA